MEGTFEHHDGFSSRHVRSRNVDVWLPPSYRRDEEGRFPVVYMQDGQNLFDPETSSIGVAWEVDRAMERLIDEGRVREAILVGIWKTEIRYQEYMPRRPLESPDGRRIKAELESQYGSAVLSDRYLTFLVEELKPFVDREYRTLSGRGDTVIAGSSMGALISLYAVCEYPETFGGAGCLSTHWPVGEGIVIEYLRESLPPPGAHRFYFDLGTRTLDESYEPYQERADGVMKTAGYVEGRDWISRTFHGAEHSERAWRERVHIPLEFLLGGTRPGKKK